MATSFEGGGRTWIIHLTHDRIDEINELLKLDLLEPWDGRVVGAVTGSTRTFAEVMRRAVKLETPKDGKDLADALRDEVLDLATRAFWREVACFFPAGQREAFLVLVEKAFKTHGAELMSAAEAVSKLPPASFMAKAVPTVKRRKRKGGGRTLAITKR